MAAGDEKRIPGPEHLLAIIRLQNEIVASRLDLERVMRIVVDRAGALTGAEGAVLEIVEGDEMVYRAVSGCLSPTLGLRVRRDGSLSGACVRQNTPLRSDDTESDDRVDREACRRVGARSMICVPLVYQTEPVGVLEVVAHAPRRFGDEELSTLALLADTVAASMGHAKEYELAVHGSLHDGLTGLWNRRAFEDRIEQELARHRRYGSALSVAALDLDGFKAANDRWGHAAGDDVLRRVATILREQTRATDVCFRVGGDEFVVLMPSTVLVSARLVIERIGARVAAAGLAEGTVGISAGAVEARGESAEELIAAADAAMYAEKRRKKGARQ